MHFDVTIIADDLNRVADIARQVEDYGFAGLWTAETAHNPFLPLTHAASATQRIELGTAIALAFPRSPMVTAQIAWDLAAQSDGRFILGLGTQIKARITRRFGMEWRAPVPRLREYIESLRAIWANWQHAKPLRYKGEHYRFTRSQPRRDCPKLRRLRRHGRQPGRDAAPCRSRQNANSVNHGF